LMINLVFVEIASFKYFPPNSKLFVLAGRYYARIIFAPTRNIVHKFVLNRLLQ
jgi:hypothetical protein